MHLKSLTLKGFKSFASATTLRFEPGITAVVGPNGSGKSNVVDALAWVMGEQGAKSLRGGKMEDVIFAGTSGRDGSSGRAPLGRAEVSLTIDNTDGALPIDYTEVTISRIMFRNGGSRVRHQRPAVPAARRPGAALRLAASAARCTSSSARASSTPCCPPARRSAAASSRRPPASSSTASARRRRSASWRRCRPTSPGCRTSPSSCAASSSRSAGRPRWPAAPASSRPTCATRGCGCWPTTWSSCPRRSRPRSPTRPRCAPAGPRSRQRWPRRGNARPSSSRLAAAEAPALARAQETWYRLSGLRERLPRHRRPGRRAASGSSPTSPPRTSAPAATPRSWRPRPRSVRARRHELGRASSRERGGPAGGGRRRPRRRPRRRWPPRSAGVAAAPRAAADRREGLARLAGQVAARRSRVEAARGRDRPAQPRPWPRRAQRAAAAAGRVQPLSRPRSPGSSRARRTSTPTTRRPRRGWRPPSAEVGELRDAGAGRRARARRPGRRARGARSSAWPARTAPAPCWPPATGSPACSARSPRCSPSQPGHEAAVAAALGAAADAVAVATLRRRGRPRCGCSRTTTPAGPACSSAQRPGRRPARRAAGRTCRPARARALDLVEAPDVAPRRRSTALLDRVAVVDDLADRAGRWSSARPGLAAVTADGDVLGRDRAAGGSPAAPSLLEVQAAVDEAASPRCRGRATASSGCSFAPATGAATSRPAASPRTCRPPCDRLHESDARLAAVAERLGQLGAQPARPRGEAERLGRLDRGRRRGARTPTGAALAELEERLRRRRRQDGPDDAEPDTALRDELGRGRPRRPRRPRSRPGSPCAPARSGSARSPAAPSSSSRPPPQEREARAQAAARAQCRRAPRGRRRRRGRAGRPGRAGPPRALAARAADGAREAERGPRRRDGELARPARPGAASWPRAERLTDSVHRDEVARTEQRLRIEALRGQGARGPRHRARDAAGRGVRAATCWCRRHRRRRGDEVADERRAAARRRTSRAEQEKRLPRAPSAHWPCSAGSTRWRWRSSRARGAPPVPDRAARGPQGHPARPDGQSSGRSTSGSSRSSPRPTRTPRASSSASSRRLFPGGEGRLVLTDPTTC